MSDPSRADAAVQALDALRRRYQSSVGTTLDAFRALAARLAEQPGAPEVIETLRRELHRVHGTAGSYGFAEASRLSGVIEERALRWAADGRLELHERAAILLRYIEALKQAFGDEHATQALDAPLASSRRLLAVDLPASMLGSLSDEGRMRGYEVVAKGAGEWGPASLRSSAPHVACTTPGSARAVHRALSGMSVPLIVIEDGNDPEATRQAAELAGVRFVHAVGSDAAAVFDVVSRLSARTSWSGARVLVCDDDPDVLALVRLIVEDVGLEVRTLASPDRLLEELERTDPSLLLLDVNLGQADGIALARSIRQLRGFAHLPLILFSTAVDARTRQAALDAGADEFLPKPIVASELRARIATRLDAERLRRLDEGRHPGTGLPLVERFRKGMAERVARCRADGSPLVVAVVRPVEAVRSGGAPVAWHAEARRIAESVRETLDPTFVGYADDLALGIVLLGPAAALVDALRTLGERRANDVPAWHVGIADLAAVHPTADALLVAAAEAASAAEGAGEAVKVWSREDAHLAPDVLVVEDDVALADMLRYALDTQGYSYRVYVTGTEALDAMLAMRPVSGRRPLVLLDVDLPGIDGHSLHERLRVERPGAFAIVFASLHGSEGEQLRALRAGALDYIVKPVSLRVLMAKIPLWIAATRESRG